jgi:hypothetical protein
MIFYWLDSFTQCRLSFFHYDLGLNPTSCTTLFLIFYVNLTTRLANVPDVEFVCMEGCSGLI